MSAYPDTATLAAFRREIASERIDHGWLAVMHASPFVGPSWTAAWPAECQYGIGYRAGHRGNLIWSQNDPATEARAEASAMRSRAYASRADTDGHGIYWPEAACMSERMHGCPPVGYDDHYGVDG